MSSLLEGSVLEKNIKCLIHHYAGTPALNAQDMGGNNLLHLAASIPESTFTIDIIKVEGFSMQTHIHVSLQLLFNAGVDATHENHEGFNPRDTANYRKNWAVKEILNDYLSGNTGHIRISFIDCFAWSSFHVPFILNN